MISMICKVPKDFENKNRGKIIHYLLHRNDDRNIVNNIFIVSMAR